MGVRLIEGHYGTRGVCIDTSRTPVVLSDASPRLSVVEGRFPSLRVVESEVEEVLRASSPASNNLWLIVVEHV